MNTTAASTLMGRRAALVAGDFVCFLVFALLGLRNHDEGFTLHDMTRAAGPFFVAWLVAATVSGLYSAKPAGWQRTLATWLPAWALGFAGRMLLFDRPFVLAFAIVSFLFLGSLMTAWRLVASRLLLRAEA